MERICVALDVEMTGLQPGVDEIIEVAAVKFRGQEVLDSFSQLVKPRQALPLKITRLTGITTEALETAPRFNDIAPAFVDFVKNYPLVGHSIESDLGMLQAQGMSFAQTVYDTFDLATLLLPQAKTYSLSALAEHLAIVHPADHRALNDADVSRQVFLNLVARIEALPLRTLAELNHLMTRTDWPSRDLFHEILKEKMGEGWDEQLMREMPSARDVKLARSTASETPLKPTNNDTPLDTDAITSFFAPEGGLSQHFTAYESRPQQAEMARQVTAAFNESNLLLVEAGTGTGKSMAYLVPAALFAMQRGERVVVSTNTINLQDQLFYKDIPDVQRMLAESSEHTTNGTEPQAQHEPSQPFTATVMKGRSNYLCLRRYKQLLRDEHLEPNEARALLKVHFWLPTTVSGDRAELLLTDKEYGAWNRLNVTTDTCTGHRCEDFRDCFFFKARKQAEAAHVVVVNHALLLADLAAQSHVLPPYDHLIIDEAHSLEDVATDQLGFSATRADMLIFLDNLYQPGNTQAQAPAGLLAEYRKSFDDSAATSSETERAEQIANDMHPTIERARQSVNECFDLLGDFVNREIAASGSHDTRLRLTSQARQKPGWSEIEQAWESLSLGLTHISSGLGKFEALLVELEAADMLNYDELLLRVQSLRRYATEVCIQMGHIIFGNEENICWLNLDQFRNTFTLNAAPLDVSEILQPQLFAEKQTVVVTSATLAVNDSFAFVKDRLGFQASREVQLESPFDYEKQALVYLPDDIPEPNQRGYQQMIEEALTRLCIATAGRALVLFTANSALRQTSQAIQDKLEEHEITVLAQGIDGSRRALLERFKEWPRTVLLGTTSFWGGVDVVGDALSVLVITKLPFNVPSDPVFAARSEQVNDPFLEYAVPQSVLRFKQGFGRLIRSQADRGIVVVLDKRLLSKRYGQQFLQSLPATNIRTGSVQQLPGVAARFIGQGR